MLIELLRLEHEGWKSLCAGTGADFYYSIMTDDAVMVLASGQVLGREAVVDALGKGRPWQRYDVYGERLISLGENDAVLVYTGRAWRGENESAFVAVMTSVYTRRSGSWRLALHQQTPVAGGN